MPGMKFIEVCALKMIPMDISIELFSAGDAVNPSNRLLLIFKMNVPIPSVMDFFGSMFL